MQMILCLHLLYTTLILLRSSAPVLIPPFLRAFPLRSPAATRTRPASPVDITRRPPDPAALAWWARAFCVIRFDLERRQLVEACYPSDALSAAGLDRLFLLPGVHVPPPPAPPLLHPRLALLLPHPSPRRAFLFSPTGLLRRKRFRTKFTPEQKEQMLAFAERLGWRMQKQDEALVDQFCAQVGVRRQVFKVWMHNNKHISRRQQPKQEQQSQQQQP